MIRFQRDFTRRIIEENSAPGGTAYYASHGFDAEQTLRLLCRLNRYVLADLPLRCAPLVHRVRQDIGAIVMLNPPPERILTATLAILEVHIDGLQLGRECLVYNVRENSLTKTSL